jgi:hypothetical protein
MSRPVRLAPHFPLACIAACALALSAAPARAAPESRIHELAQQEKAPLLDTLRDLVNIESGSKDAEGLARLAALIGERLTRLGGKVAIVEPTDIYRMDDTPEKPGAMVHAEFKGSGSRKIMLIAHMDTVYLPGMLKDQSVGWVERSDTHRPYAAALMGIASLHPTYQIHLCDLAARCARDVRSRKPALRTSLAPDAAASTATRPNVRDDGQRLSARDGMAGVVGVIWGSGEAEYFCRQD